MKTTSAARDNDQMIVPSKPKKVSKPPDAGPPKLPAEPRWLSIPVSLNTSQDDQALSYYLRCHVEVSDGWPAIVDRWDNHLRYAFTDQHYSQPQSVLSLAISAVSHATFGRARKSRAALAIGSTQYSRALVKINRVLSDPSQATHDDVLLAVMLLSFYENSAADKTSNVSSSDIETIASGSFAHHKGAMSMLRLRRRVGQRTSRSMELDKLVRRQLIRTWILLNRLPPPWFLDGSQFEEGVALGLDYCMVETAKLRHQISNLAASLASLLPSAHVELMARSYRILARAQTLDASLDTWANHLPVDYSYSIHNIEDDERIEVGDAIFDSTVHVYPTVGHAGLWNRYRTLRLIVYEIILRCLSMCARSSDSSMESLVQATTLKIRRVAEDLCASIPYLFGLLEVQHQPEQGLAVFAKVPACLKMAVKASTAAFLCWPLNEALLIHRIPERHRRYFRDRLLDVSEIVDDGVMARVAIEFFPIGH